MEEYFRIANGVEDLFELFSSLSITIESPQHDQHPDTHFLVIITNENTDELDSFNVDIPVKDIKEPTEIELLGTARALYKAIQFFLINNKTKLQLK